jgi:hypothetical protein
VTWHSRLVFSLSADVLIVKVRWIRIEGAFHLSSHQKVGYGFAIVKMNAKDSDFSSMTSSDVLQPNVFYYFLDPIKEFVVRFYSLLCEDNSLAAGIFDFGN